MSSSTRSITSFSSVSSGGSDRKLPARAIRRQSSDRFSNQRQRFERSRSFRNRRPPSVRSSTTNAYAAAPSTSAASSSFAAASSSARSSSMSAIPPPPSAAIKPASTASSSSSNRGSHSYRCTTSIEVSPGVFCPVYSSQDCWDAIRRGQCVNAECMACNTLLQCMDDAQYVLCPDCMTVSPLLDQHRRSSHGIGLGLKTQDLVAQWM